MTGRAFVHAFLSRDSLPLTINNLRELARKLLEEYGVTEILADRRGGQRGWRTERAGMAVSPYPAPSAPRRSSGPQGRSRLRERCCS